MHGILFFSRKWKLSLDNGIVRLVNWLFAGVIISLFAPSESQPSDLQALLFSLIALFSLWMAQMNKEYPAHGFQSKLFLKIYDFLQFM